MIFNLIVVACMAFAAAGATLLAFRLVGRRAPKAVLLLAAGVGMIAYTQWERYTWASRTVAGLPPSMTVMAELPYDSVLEFWARAIPRTDALVVVDGAATRSDPAHPGVVMARTLLLEHHADPLEMRQLVDCPGKRRAPVVRASGAMPGPEGWIDGGEPAALYAAVCPER
jgi:hypothetical protein